MNSGLFKRLLYGQNWKLFRFFLVGGVSTVVHFVTAETLIFEKWINNIYIINVISFLTAFLFSYLGHRYITFSKPGSMLKFFIVAAVGFSTNNILLKMGLIAGIDERIAIGVAIISVPVMTYIFSKLWVFK